MKKVILIFIACIGTFSIQAQNINPDNDNVPRDIAPDAAPFIKDNLLPRWCFDINAMGGALTQQLITNDPAASYKNALNTNISDLKFNNGISYGFDAQIGYFFGHKRHFGIGAGISYLYQQGNMTMDNFHIEYQSVDNFGNTFRQVVSADGQIKETMGISNFNIPLLLKYKTRFSKVVGFTADAGLMFNVQENNAYNSNASFDYEAIYSYGENGVSVYDNASTPAASDLLITKGRYAANHSAAEVQNYFNTLRSYGYNVGLGVKPNNNGGNVSYTSGSVGLLVRPAVSFYVSDNVALNLGVYYLYQNFNNTPGNAMLTNKAGSYNSVLNNVTNSVNNNYGISLGVRFFLCKCKPRQQAAVAPVVPDEPETVVTPPPPPPAKEEDDQEVAPEAVDISAPVLFRLNRASVQPEYYPELDEAAKEMTEDPHSYLVIHGYTDITGTALYNLALSKRRAMAVKSYLRRKGVSPRLLKTVAHGSRSPVASNKTKEGRAKNRRVMLKLKDKQN